MHGHLNIKLEMFVAVSIFMYSLFIDAISY